MADALKRLLDLDRRIIAIERHFGPVSPSSSEWRIPVPTARRSAGPWKGSRRRGASYRRSGVRGRAYQVSLQLPQQAPTSYLRGQVPSSGRLRTVCAVRKGHRTLTTNLTGLSTDRERGGEHGCERDEMRARGM
jgi:hypothetical protein